MACEFLVSFFPSRERRYLRVGYILTAGRYQVVAVKQRINDLGGAYAQFRLERLSGQPPMVVNRPSASEQVAYSKIREYY